MNKLLKEPSFSRRGKALFTSKMSRYFWIFLLLLVTEIAIAVFHFHKFIRGFLGDVLVIPLLYCFLKLFLKVSSKKLLYGILMFAFLVELLQLFNLAELLGFQDAVAAIILGTHFDFMDLVSYLLGIIPVLIIEKYSN
ncbi:MAG: DUF2809 domain-containing protein [Flavobacteriaceae bacterium]